MKKTSRNSEINAWNHYWTESPVSTNCCLPGLPIAVANQVHEIWVNFFDHLQHDARLLDMGTGNGVVLTLAKSRRPNLRLTGVDYAAALPETGDGITMCPGIRMEALPFADDSFDAITGQFAIEYGDVPAVAMEINRVLAPGGSYLFICHHAIGVIVRDNSERLAAIRGILAHAGLLETALKAVRKRKKNDPAMRRRLAAIFDTAGRKYTDRSVVQDVADDIARILAGSGSLKKLLGLRRDVELEKDRLVAMQKAALDEGRAKQMAAMLLPGQQQAQISVVHVEEVGPPLAWLISNKKKPD